MLNKVFFSLVLLLVSSCSVFSEHRDWSFVESAGGITVGGQDKNPNWLIIRGDVSGVKEFSTKPTAINSAIALKSLEHIVKKNVIQIYVVTTLTSEKYHLTEISGINISGVKKGIYKVQYLNPDNSVVELKEVVIR